MVEYCDLLETYSKTICESWRLIKMNLLACCRTIDNKEYMVNIYAAEEGKSKFIDVFWEIYIGLKNKDCVFLSFVI